MFLGRLVTKLHQVLMAEGTCCSNVTAETAQPHVLSTELDCLEQLRTLAAPGTPRHQRQHRLLREWSLTFALHLLYVFFFSQVLDLSANSIEGLPPLAAALPALVELVLDENSLRALGDELVGLLKLKKLSARSNRIAAVDPFSGQQVHVLSCFVVAAATASISQIVLKRVLLSEPPPTNYSHEYPRSISFLVSLAAVVVGSRRFHEGTVVVLSLVHSSSSASSRFYQSKHTDKSPQPSAVSHAFSRSVSNALKLDGNVGDLSRAVRRIYGRVLGARRQRHRQDGPDADGRGGRFPGSQRKEQEQEPTGRRDADALCLRSGLISCLNAVFFEEKTLEVGRRKFEALFPFPLLHQVRENWLFSPMPWMSN